MQSIRQKARSVKGSFKQLRKDMKVARVGAIARRYFVLNAFDGVLTALGLVLGAYAVGLPDPDFILSAGIGVSIALGLSGVWSAYMAEKAERTRSLKELEDALFTDLKNSRLDRAARGATIWVAFVNGVSPVAAAIIVISPFFVARAGFLPVDIAVYISVAITMIILFLIGIFLGRTSKENILLHGTKMAAAGVVITIILLLLRAVV
jgi:predicted membrane protein (TIGR00267 family)